MNRSSTGSKHEGGFRAGGKTPVFVNDKEALISCFCACEPIGSLLEFSRFLVAQVLVLKVNSLLLCLQCFAYSMEILPIAGVDIVSHWLLNTKRQLLPSA